MGLGGAGGAGDPQELVTPPPKMLAGLRVLWGPLGTRRG